MNVFLHKNNKNVNNKVTWAYYTNNWKSPLIVMVKPWHCYSCTIVWQSLQFKWLNEEYIILWTSIWYYYFCDNMMAQSTVIMEKNPLLTYPLIEWTTPVISIPQMKYRWMGDINPIKYLSEDIVFWFPVKREV